MMFPGIRRGSDSLMARRPDILIHGLDDKPRA